MKYSYNGQILVIEDYKYVANLSEAMIWLAEYKISGTGLKIIRLDGYEVWIKGKIEKMEMGNNEIQAKNE